MSPAEFDAEIAKLAKAATDKGLLVALGFLGFRRFFLGKDATDRQVADAQRAFYAGAQHLYGSIMGILEEGAEPTENDLKRMALVDAELRDFYEQMQAFLKKKAH